MVSLGNLRVTQATLIARILYALPAWWGFLSVVEKDRTGSVSLRERSSFENAQSLVDTVESTLCAIKNETHLFL